MQPGEMAMHCLKAMQLLGMDAPVTFKIKGRWGNKTHMRLWPRGPKGKIVADGVPPGHCVVMFEAAEVLAALGCEVKQVGDRALELVLPPVPGRGAARDDSLRRRSS